MFAKVEKTLEDRMGFGKYKNNTIEEVLNLDPSYLVWAHENVDWFKLEPQIYESALDRTFEESYNYTDLDDNDFMD